MAKSKLLKLAALAFAAVLAGCASNSSTDADSGDTSTVEDVVTEETGSTGGDELIIIEESVEETVEEVAEMITPEVSTVYFDFDKANVKPEWKDALDAHAAYLISNPGSSVILEGHCDERGTREYNLALGERRATAVSAYLKLNGVATSQIEIVSFGEEKPVDLGKTDAAYSLNRRVEIKYQ